MSLLFGQPYDRDSARRLTGHPQQVVGADLYEALDGEARGQRFVRIRAGDIDCDVAVDRGLDLARLSFRGLPVHWMSPAGFRTRPDSTREPWSPKVGGNCGLGPAACSARSATTMSVPPAVYPHRHGHPAVSAVRSPIHGRSSYSPTYLRGYGVEREEVVVEGEVRQAAPFAEHLVLRRSIRAMVGGASVRVDDVVRNDGYTAEPVQMLYHLSFGWPLLAPGNGVRMSPARIVATTDAAGHDDPMVTPAPQRGAVEQVWDRACETGPQWAAVVNEGVGGRGPLAAVVEWDGEELPHLIQWRISGESMYALGLEPSTTGLGGRDAEEQDGRLRWVQPGDSRHFSLTLRFETGDAALSLLEQ